MCGILGIFNHDLAADLMQKGLHKIKNRGKDGFGAASQNSLVYANTILQLKQQLAQLNRNDNPRNILGHILHSIVSKVPQPFATENSLFVANCEIYNWWKLSKKYNISARNDAELAFFLIEKKGIEIIDDFDGDFSFAYWDKKNNKVIIARDIVGVKPLWYCHHDFFAFSSEKKALLEMGFLNPIELNPRHIIVYDIKENTIEFKHRKFFDAISETKLEVKPSQNKPSQNEIGTADKKEIEKKLFGLLTNAVAKRVPEKKLGLLFSGGVDSTFIALILKQLDVPFTCYVAAAEDETAKSEDLLYAKKAATALDLDLKIAKINFSQVQNYLKKVVPLIEDTNVIKVGVALPFFVACEAARKDGVKVILSGLGSEELFAGYERHTHAKLINSECRAGLQKIYERDLYRDDVVTMDNNIELRVPFLDNELIDFSLKIPAELKIKDGFGKYILRAAAQNFGMPKEFAWRKKRAAQYGSRFDKAIERLSKKNGFKSKSDYLRTFYKDANLKLGVLFSGGKDSVYAMQIIHDQNYQIACLISIKSKNQDSFMFHTPNISLTQLQSESLGIPLITHETNGEKENELIDLKNAILQAVKKYSIEGIVTGALFSDYQRQRIEKIADELGIKMFSPLWHMNQADEMTHLVDNFEIVLSSVAAEGLNKSWLGRTLTQSDVKKLIDLNKRFGLNVAGEGGEFESLVLDCKMFKKKIKIFDFEITSEKENVARMVVKKAKLVEKN